MVEIFVMLSKLKSVHGIFRYNIHNEGQIESFEIFVITCPTSNGAPLAFL